jgi:hypothetical protein
MPDGAGARRHWHRYAGAPSRSSALSWIQESADSIMSRSFFVVFQLRMVML